LHIFISVYPTWKACGRSCHWYKWWHIRSRRWSYVKVYDHVAKV